MTDISIGDRIRKIRRNLGLTQKAFADPLGIAQGYLSSIECGRQVPSDTLLIALRHLYRIDEGWLSSGEGEPDAGDAAMSGFPSRPSEGRIPLLGRVASDFPLGLKAEDIVGHVTFPENPPDGYALQAYGDFMAPTIQDSDLVLFKVGGEPVNGNIVLVNSKWGDILLRRYRLRSDGPWLTPDNSMYTPFQPGGTSRIIGIVTDVWRRMKL